MVDKRLTVNFLKEQSLINYLHILRVFFIHLIIVTKAYC